MLPAFVFFNRFRLIPGETVKHTSGLYGHQRCHTRFEWYRIELIPARSWESRQVCIPVLLPTQCAWMVKCYIHKLRIPFQGSTSSVSTCKSTDFLFWRHPKTKNQEHHFISLLLLEIQFRQRHESPMQNRVQSFCSGLALVPSLMLCNRSKTQNVS